MYDPFKISHDIDLSCPSFQLIMFSADRVIYDFIVRVCVCNIFDHSVIRKPVTVHHIFHFILLYFDYIIYYLICQTLSIRIKLYIFAWFFKTRAISTDFGFSVLNTVPRSTSLTQIASLWQYLHPDTNRPEQFLTVISGITQDDLCSCPLPWSIFSPHIKNASGRTRRS